MADPSYIVDGVLTDGEAWVGIDTTTLDSPAASVTFESPNDGSSTDWSQFMDLVLIAYGHGDTSAGAKASYCIHLNGVETGTTYYKQAMYSDGSSVTASSNSGGAEARMAIVDWPTDTDGANIFGVAIVNFYDINSGKYKSMTSQGASDCDGSGYMWIQNNTSVSQAPLTSITSKCFRGASAVDFDTGSMFSLFGVLPRMVA